MEFGAAAEGARLGEVGVSVDVPHGRFRNLLPVTALLAYFLLVFAIQLHTGTFQSELSHYSDEPSHVVTALMIRDYVAGGLFENPVRFAERYYIHYPKVAIGMWPPFFHGATAVWTLIFGATRVSLLNWMAFQAAALALATFLLARQLMAQWLAFLCGAVLILLRMVQEVETVVMVDVLLSLLSLLTAFALFRFFQDGTTRSAIWFGTAMGLAMMTKGNANCLAVMPVLLLLLTRRWDLLRRPGLYWAALAAALLGLPWQFLSLRFLQNSVPMAPFSVGRVVEMGSAYFQIMARGLGWPILAAATAGIAFSIWALRKDPRDPRALLAAALACLAASVLVFHAVAPVPGPENRYMVVTLAPLAVLFGVGIEAVIALLPSFAVPRPALAVALSLGCLAGSASAWLPPPARPAIGFQGVTDQLGTRPDEVILVSSDAEGEGALITEVALQDQRPGRYVLRASKVLGEGDWFHGSWRSLHETPKDVLDYLDSVPVDYAVVDRSHYAFPQEQRLMLLALSEAPERWQKLDRPQRSLPSSQNRPIDVYRRVRNPNDLVPAKKNIQLHMRYTLGRDLNLR